MPIYEYRCRACGREFETYVATAATAVACPHCDGVEVTRTLSVFGLKTDGAFLPSAAAGSGGCCGGGCACH
ncbi:MAG: zinc ribbon domain-containing protein [Candidatus Rokubacteria bacterium]|nr:zinc ribbon domain-containing protein [Candidatus Rokubacteria bacterium]